MTQKLESFGIRKDEQLTPKPALHQCLCKGGERGHTGD